MVHPFRGRAHTRGFDKGQCSLVDVWRVLCPKTTSRGPLKLGEFNRRAHLDLIQHALQARVIRADTRRAHFLGQPFYLGGRKPPFQQADSHLIQHVEQAAAPRGGLAAALCGGFQALGGEQSAQGGGWRSRRRARRRRRRGGAVGRQREAGRSRLTRATGGFR